MKKTFYFLTLSFLAVSCANVTKTSTGSKQQPEVINKQGEFNPDRALTAGNFEISIPETWEQTIEKAKAVNLKDEVMAIENAFFDPKNQTYVRLVEHPGNTGLQLYDAYAHSKQYQPEKINIAGKTALMFNEYITTDGKGHELAVPVQRHKIYLPDKNGSLEIVFDIPDDNQTKGNNQLKRFIEGIKTLN